MRGLNGVGGIKSSRRAGERGRALRGGGLDDVRDFESGDTRRLCLGFGFAVAPGGVLGGGLIKLQSATINDISVGVGRGRSTRVLCGRRGGGDWPRGDRGNFGLTQSLAGTLWGQGGLGGWCANNSGCHTM